MDKIILGILMIHRMTAYELRTTIKASFKSMCSDSLGSIQAALKKLLELRMVTFEEIVEKGVYKKRYSITDKGQAALLDWIKIPADMSKTRNQDVGKLLFMGYVSKKEQAELVEKIIVALEKEYEEMKSLKKSIDKEAERAEIERYLLADKEYGQRIKALGKENNLSENIGEISRFAMEALDYGVAMAAFNIDWCKKLRERIL